MTLGNLWNHFRDEFNFDANEIVANRRLNNTKTEITKSFECKAKTMERIPANSDDLDTEVFVSLKFLDNF